MLQITRPKIRSWAMLGQRGAVFGDALPAIAAETDNLRVLSADLSLLSGMERFIKKFPDKYLQTGIAEQNMMGIAGGLATEGERVIASTYCSFIAVRSLEQVRQNIAYPNADVKIIGSSAGVVAARSGVSHWATEDLAFMRVLPNLTVFSPCDAAEAVRCLYAAMEERGPVYLRLSGGLNCPQVYAEDWKFEKGVPFRLRQGNDVALLATGLMVKESLDAAELLQQQGISAAVYDVHTLKPLDRQAFAAIFDAYPLIATVEEHTVLGGLGGTVAELKAERAQGPRQIFIGFQDTYTRAGSQRYIWELAGLTAEKIAKRVAKEF